MKTKLPLFVACVAFVFYTNISTAQEQDAQGGSGGGLSSLFNGIGSMIGGITNTAGQVDNKVNASTKQDGGDQQPSAGSNSQIMDILKLEASKDKPLQMVCSEEHFQYVISQNVTGPFQRAEYSMAAPGAAMVAGYMAQCSLQDQANLAQWSNRVGLMLAYASISWKISGAGDTPQVSATAGRAITLLSYAKQNNVDGASQTLEKMKENGFVISEEKAAKPKGKIALAASSAEVANKFKGNSLAFHKKYTGETLQVKGPVRLVQERSGKTPGANVIITGVVKNRDDVTSADEIMCEITDNKGTSAAADLEPGKTITASGLYDPKLRSYGLSESQVILHDCQIR